MFKKVPGLFSEAENKPGTFFGKRYTVLSMI